MVASSQSDPIVMPPTTTTRTGNAQAAALYRPGRHRAIHVHCAAETSLQLRQRRGLELYQRRSGRVDLVHRARYGAGRSRRSRLKASNFTAGARWFAKKHVAFTFDARFTLLNPGIPNGPLGLSPRTTMFVFGAGVSVVRARLIDASVLKFAPARLGPSHTNTIIRTPEGGVQAAITDASVRPRSCSAPTTYVRERAEADADVVGEAGARSAGRTSENAPTNGRARRQAGRESPIAERADPQQRPARRDEYSGVDATPAHRERQRTAAADLRLRTNPHRFAPMTPPAFSASRNGRRPPIDGGGFTRTQNEK